jgi:hypothetical protein
MEKEMAYQPLLQLNPLKKGNLKKKRTQING